MTVCVSVYVCDHMHVCIYVCVCVCVCICVCVCVCVCDITGPGIDTYIKTRKVLSPQSLLCKA